MFTDRFSALSFKTKLQVTVTFLCLLLVLLSLTAIEKTFKDATKEKIGQDFIKTQAALRHLMDAKINAFKDSIEMMLADPLFRSQVSRTNSLTSDFGFASLTQAKKDQKKAIKESHQIFLSVDLPVFHRYPVFSILNENGVLLFSKADLKVFNTDLSNIVWIQKVLNEGRSLQLIAATDPLYMNAGLIPPLGNENDLYLIYGQAIYSGTHSVGLVLAAEKASDILLKPIRDSFFSTLVLKSGEGKFATVDSRFELNRRPLLKAISLMSSLSSESSLNLKSIKLNQENFLVLQTPIISILEKNQIGSMYLLRSLDAEMAPLLNKLHFYFLLIFLISTLFSFWAVTFLSNRITKPLFALEQGMKRLQSGDLSIQVPQTSLDEVGYLTRAFNKMAMSIKEKTQIELLLGKLKKELTAAREIQRSLLPPENQKFDAIQLDCLYHPCDELSGDFYDYILTEEWIYFYLADVTSHGTAAAQVTYLIKEIFRNLLRERSYFHLPELLEKVFQRYAAYQLKYDAGLHVARIHRKTYELQNSRSNAPSAILIRDQSINSLDPPPGPLLNAQFNCHNARVDFPVLCNRLTAQDQIYFFTDGAYEFEYGKGLFGTKRFYPLLLETSETKAKSAETNPWKALLIKSLAEANRSEGFEDDLTVVKLTVH
jgi:serine phosphatase RsbU (regulator of sigma subunit)